MKELKERYYTGKGVAQVEIQYVINKTNTIQQESDTGGGQTNKLLAKTRKHIMMIMMNSKEETSRAVFVTGPGAGAQLWKV